MGASVASALGGLSLGGFSLRSLGSLSLRGLGLRSFSLRSLGCLSLRGLGYIATRQGRSLRSCLLIDNLLLLISGASAAKVAGIAATEPAVKAAAAAICNATGVFDIFLDL